MSNTDLALGFLKLVMKYRNEWSYANPRHTPEEIELLVCVVREAGFDGRAIHPGHLYGRYRDQDGSAGRAFPINTCCAFVVEGPDTDFATGWLDCLVRRTRDREYVWKAATAKNKAVAISFVVKEIERSRPFIPILLTAEGDTLTECQPQPLCDCTEYLVDHTRDDNQLRSCVGVHRRCGGGIYRIGATDDCDALSCANCRIRILFPQGIKTYGDLRIHMEKALQIA